jgi:hypothetical protein
MITGSYARRFLAMAAEQNECCVFAQIGNAVILRMIEVIAGNPAFFAFVTNLQVNE